MEFFKDMFKNSKKFSDQEHGICRVGMSMKYMPHNHTEQSQAKLGLMLPGYLSKSLTSLTSAFSAVTRTV